MKLDPTTLRIRFGDRLAPDGSLVADNFARWYSDSKLVDELGAPIVMFHGTAGDVESFDVSRAGTQKYSDWGPGIYFTPSASTADYYRGEAAKAADGLAQTMWRKLEELEKWTTWKNGTPTHHRFHQPLLEQWRARRAVAENEAGSVMPVYVSIKNPYILPYQSMPDPTLAAHAAAAGHDGIFVLDGHGEINEVVAFNAGQVKSALGNSGLFLPNSIDLADHCWSAASRMKHDPAAAQKLFGDRVATNGERVADNFTSWFGKSRVVDEAGAPIVVYHGTHTAFDTFRAPAWFSPSREMADFFANQPKDEFDTDEEHPDGYDGVEQVPQVVPVYLSMQNPLLTNDWGITEGRAFEPEWIAEQIAAGYDGVIFEIDHRSDGYGNDGEIEVEYIVFSPNQIKSALHNSGLFDRTSADMTDAHGRHNSDRPNEDFEEPDAPVERERERA